jgi:hypothetical protein
MKDVISILGMSVAPSVEQLGSHRVASLLDHLGAHVPTDMTCFAAGWTKLR